jgi:hypothetical protein
MRGTRCGGNNISVAKISQCRNLQQMFLWAQLLSAWWYPFPPRLISAVVTTPLCTYMIAWSMQSLIERREG